MKFVPFLFLFCGINLHLNRYLSARAPNPDNPANFFPRPGAYPPDTLLPAKMQNDTIFLEDLLRKYPQYFSKILQNRSYYRVQILYTQIDRDGLNNPSFRNYYFNVNRQTYFYPASTVKMPVALLALQKLKELGLPGLEKNSSMLTEKEYSGQTAVLNDPTTADGRPTIGNYVKKIFLVSDNDAFNRLYEFLGQEYIHQHLQNMGYEDARIMHRLEISLTEDENRHTNPVSFFEPSGKFLYQQPMLSSQVKFSTEADSIGLGYYKGDQLINHPMDFSKKNRIGLEDLHRILRSIIFPGTIPAAQRFNLTEEDYNFVYQYMSQYPSESKYPYYDTASNWDAFGKFLFWGSQKGSLPKNIRIFNKEGDAYGFLTDLSYFTDLDRNIEFLLSATIYCNSDGILNDDKYDYDSVGLPFMKQLGRVVYDFELRRNRTHIPNLSKFRLRYEK
jgi:Beta-lactamase enzyme family